MVEECAEESDENKKIDVFVRFTILNLDGCHITNQMAYEYRHSKPEINSMHARTLGLFIF